MTLPRLTLSQLLNPEFSASRLVSAGMSQVEASAKGNRFAAAANALVTAGRSVNDPAYAAFVPGRIEVLGKHTDYCGGRSLLCTVERGMCFVASSTANRQVRFFAMDPNESAEWALDPELQPATRHWSNYPMTVTRRIARNFPQIAVGADIAMGSDLPPASGLSSSSAMIIGTFLMLSGMNDLQNRGEYRSNIRSRQDLAAYLGCVENGQSFGSLVGDRGVGTFGGSEDHTAILCCRANTLSVYSFCPIRHERDITLPQDLRFFIAASGVVAEKTGDALVKYNRVSLRARDIVSLWNQANGAKANCLNDIVASGPPALQRLRSLVADSPREPLDRLISRLEQFLTESNMLIPAAGDAIANAEWSRLGQIVDQSQHLSETGLENQVPETIELHKAMMKSGAIAASAFGAGFGGSVWALYSINDKDDLADRIKSSATGFVTRPGCPTTEIV